MALTGVGFATFQRFWPLMLVAVVGTLNPSAGDVSLFLPTEQSALAELTPDEGRTGRFAIYNLAAGMAARARRARPAPRRIAIGAAPTRRNTSDSASSCTWPRRSPRPRVTGDCAWCGESSRAARPCIAHDVS